MRSRHCRHICCPRVFTSSTIIGGLVGLVIFGAFGIFKLKESNDIFQQGLRLMAMIGFVDDCGFWFR